MTQKCLDEICQAQSRKCGGILFCENTKKSLSQGPLSCDSLRMEIFAIYRNQTVALLGFEGDEALISFDDGGEEYVAIESLDILPLKNPCAGSIPVLLFPSHQPLATMKEVPTPSVKITAAIARNKVAEQIVKDALKPKGPTLAQFALKPRPLMRGGRDVS